MPLALTPELQARLAKTMTTKSPIAAPDFDPIDYINRLFPNEQCLANVDPILTKIQNKEQEMSRAAERLTTLSFTQDSQGVEELQEAKKAISDLFATVGEIKQKAAQSESMVQDITQDVKSLDCAKRHLTLSVTALKRLQMLVTAVDQLEAMYKKKQYKEAAQLLQAAFQLLQHFDSYKGVTQISQLSDRIFQLQRQLEASILHEFDNGFQSDGALKAPSWILHDACLVAAVLGDKTKEKVIKRYVDLQLAGYRQIFRPQEEVSQLDNVSRRYAWLKRTLKTCDENHADIFPPEWCVSGRLCMTFCEITRADLKQVLANSPEPDVKELLKALQLTIEFEAQLTKRYERHRTPEGPLFKFEKAISSSFQSCLWIYINAEDRALSDMIRNYVNSDARVEDDGSMVVLPSSTDLFYFYRETLVQCARFSTGSSFYDLCQLFAKHLNSYCDTILLGGLNRRSNDPTTAEKLRDASLALNTSDYCAMTTGQLEDKLKEKIDEEYTERINFDSVKEAFMRTVSACIDDIVRSLESLCDAKLQQMGKIPWGDMDTVGDQSDYVSQLQEDVRALCAVLAKTIANKRYYRTFLDRFAEAFINRYLVQIYKCRPISEIGAEQMLLDTHAIKTLLMDLPTLGSEAGPSASFSRIVSRGMGRAETILKAVMTPADPVEGFIESYFVLFGDRHMGNCIKLMDIKGIKKPEQQHFLDVFQRRSTQRSDLAEDAHILPEVDATQHTNTSATHLPHAITTSLSSIASTAGVNPNGLQFGPRLASASPTDAPASPGSSRATGRLNENFRKLVMTGMAFRKDLQERREQAGSKDRFS